MKSKIINHFRSGVIYPVRFIPVLIILLLFGLSATAYSQNRDYSSHPEIPFKYENLNLKLNLDLHQDLIKGEAIYTLSPYLDHSTKILMKAYRTDIKAITVNGKQVPYHLNNDSLSINLPKAFPSGTNFKLKIIYEAQPQFGWHKNSSGTYWTSLLPMSVDHIFPVFDHPRITVKTHLQLIIPSNMDAVANGRLVGQKIIKKGWKEVTWKTIQPIPVTNISFAVGHFQHFETMFGVKTIRLYVQKGLLSQQQSNQLLQTAYNTLQKVQNYLSVEYPYSDLNIVILPDHHWEVRNYAASYCYLFKNRGNFKDQLRKAIYAQWFGVYQRSEQFGGAQPQIMYQAWLQWNLQHKIQKGWKNEESPESPQTLYNVFDNNQWRRWQTFFKVTSDSNFIETLKETTPGLIAKQSGVMNWDDYARYWYGKTGHWFMIPTLPKLHKKHVLKYQIKYTYDETKGILKSIIKPLKGKSNELITVPFVMYENKGLVRKKLTFSGIGDTLSNKMSNGLLNVSVNVPDSMNVKITEKKPISFWYYQLKNGSNPAQRAQAAKALGTFQGDPDLQLALVDVLHKDPSPKVKVAVLESLAKITSGASGTDQIFLNQLDSNNEKVKKAVVQALTNYPGDQSAIMAVQGIINRNDVSPDLKRAALVTMQKINSGSKYENFARQFISKDSTHVYASTMLHTLIQNGDTTYVDSLANRFVASKYPYELRKKSLDLIENLKHSPKYWTNLISQLVQDNDPRIRFLGWKLYKHLNKKQVDKMIKKYLPEEYDLRVKDEIMSVEQAVNNTGKSSK